MIWLFLLQKKTFCRNLSPNFIQNQVFQKILNRFNQMKSQIKRQYFSFLFGESFFKTICKILKFYHFFASNKWRKNRLLYKLNGSILTNTVSNWRIWHFLPHSGKYWEIFMKKYKTYKSWNWAKPMPSGRENSRYFFYYFRKC